MLRGPLDRLLDFTVIPGFSSIGYRARSGSFAPTPDLRGRRILITGATSGLGAAACEILAEAGSDVSVGALIGRIEAGGAAVAPGVKEAAKEQALGEGSGPPSPLSAPARAIEKAETAAADATAQAGPGADGAAQAGPAARKLAAEKGIDLAAVPA